jgi:hypothetical protein
MRSKNLTAGYDEYIIKSELVNHHHQKNMIIFLFSVIALTLVSLFLLATIANAQTPKSTSGADSTSSNEDGVKQMGICVIGAGSPCNGDTNSPK